MLLQSLLLLHLITAPPINCRYCKKVVLLQSYHQFCGLLLGRSPRRGASPYDIARIGAVNGTVCAVSVTRISGGMPLLMATGLMTASAQDLVRLAKLGAQLAAPPQQQMIITDDALAAPAANTTSTASLPANDIALLYSALDAELPHCQRHAPSLLRPPLTEKHQLADKIARPRSLRCSSGRHCH